MAELLVPIAWDEQGAYVRPADVPIMQARRSFTCPECDGRLSVRAGGGSRARRHFAHRSDAPHCAFGGGGEGALHATAKHAVLAAVRAALAGGPAPRIDRLCARCGTVHRREVPLARMAIVGARDEYRHRTASGFVPVADIALMRADGLPAAFLEVHDSHAVDERKEQALDVKWIELEASALVADPLLWVPLNGGLLGEVRCNCRGLVIVPTWNGHVDCPAKGRPLTVELCARCRYHAPKDATALSTRPSVYCRAPHDVIEQQRTRDRQKQERAEKAEAARLERERVRFDLENDRELDRERRRDLWVKERARLDQERSAREEAERRGSPQMRRAWAFLPVGEVAAAEARRLDRERWLAWVQTIGMHNEVLPLAVRTHATDEVGPEDRFKVQCPKVGPTSHTSCTSCPFFVARLVRHAAADAWTGVVCGFSSGNTRASTGVNELVLVDEAYLDRSIGPTAPQIKGDDE